MCVAVCVLHLRQQVAHCMTLPPTRTTNGKIQQACSVCVYIVFMHICICVASISPRARRVHALRVDTPAWIVARWRQHDRSSMGRIHGAPKFGHMQSVLSHIACAHYYASPFERLPVLSPLVPNRLISRARARLHKRNVCPYALRAPHVLCADAAKMLSHTLSFLLPGDQPSVSIV